ncbi:hypothetical protein CBR_g3080 [Chara braunii]|uniref:Integrase catalytic domain-containing protein n=1 Tax=Chara braunii TaxID=69332 RepID=A0A388KEV8_CHABU|nr:hypothetical protein CBR_g3080 [Chara braunii]|eukprot:GBG68536.1 hypothetical protein CBR_g3080 [Chara braunii]
MVVPHPFMRYDWVKTTHKEIAAHFAVRITESAIDKNKWYWSNIRDDVKYIVANCQVCAADKAPIQPPRSIVPTVVERPFQRVRMDTTDIVVPPHPNSCDHPVLLVFVDHFSKWIEAYPCRTWQATEIARYVNRFLGMHQDTEEILTDNGAEFRGEVLRNLVLHDVAIQNTAPHMSHSNGLVENANRVIKTALRRNIAARDPRPWLDIVDHILAVHRGTPHESTRLSPFQLRTNSVACISIPSLPNETTLNRRPTRATARDKAKRHLELMERSLPRLARKRQKMTELAQGRQVWSYEARNGNAGPRPQYKLGDVARVRKCARQGKLAPRFFGRYRVIELCPNGVDTVRLAPEVSDSRSARPITRHVHPTTEQLAAIREEEEEEESTERDEGEDEREESGESDKVFGEEDETPEEGSYSEHSEGEPSEEEEEDDEGEEGHEEESAGSEWEAMPEEALRTGTEAEDPEAARKREEIAAGKTELELASAASL